MCKKSRGRPKVFDRDAALDKAMNCSGNTVMKRLLLRTSSKRPSQSAHAIRGIYQQRGVISCRLDRYIDRFAAKHEAQLFCEGKAWSLRWLTILLPSPTALPQRHPGRLLHDQQLHHPLPRLGDIANTLKSRHAMQERTLQRFYVNDKRAGKSRPTVT